MHPLIKAFIGILLIVAAVWYIFKGLVIPGVLSLAPAWNDVKIVLNGSIPLFVALMGFFIAWLEYDEWKIEKELREEEEKEKRARQKRKRSRRKKR